MDEGVATRAHGTRTAGGGSAVEVASLPAGFGAWVIAPLGRLDMGALPALKAEIRRLRALGCRQLVVDLSAVTVMDATVIVVLRLARHVRLRRGEFVLVCAEASLARRLRRSRFRVFPTLDEAAVKLGLDVAGQRAPRGA